MRDVETAEMPVSQDPSSFTLNIGIDGRAPAAEFHALPRFGLYVISHGHQVLRVGESGSGEARLRKGFREPLRKLVRGKERKNYLAYAWRDDYRDKRLKVDYFGLSEERFSNSQFRRALEAEVTFQFRIAHRAWPSRMNEIHFTEVHRTDPLLIQAARVILLHYEIRHDDAL